MKKFIAVFLSMALLLSLAACSSDADRKHKKDKQGKSDEDNTLTIEFEDGNSSNETNNASPAETEPENTIPEFDYIDFDIEYDNDNEWVGMGGYNYPSVYKEVAAVTVTDNRFPKLQNSISKIEENDLSYITEQYNNHVNVGTDNSNFNSSIYRNITVLRSDSVVFSYVSDTTILANNNGSSYQDELFYSAVSINPVTGEMIATSDVITDMDLFAQTALEEITPYFSIRNPLENYEEIFTTMLKNGEVAIGLQLDGVYITFDMIKLTGAYSHCIGFKIPYINNEDCLSSAYFDQLPDDYALNFSRSNTLDWDIDNDGQPDHIEIIGDEIDYYINPFTVRVNGNNLLDINEYGLFSSSKLLKYKDNYYIYLTIYTENDYHNTEIIRLNNGSAEYIGTVEDMGPEIMINPSKIVFSGKVDCLSSMTGFVDYSVGDDGLPVKINNDVRLNCFYSMVTKVQLEGINVADNSSVVIESGTTILHYMTDNNSYIDFYIKDGDYAGTIVRFNVDLSWNNGQSINGISARDAFVCTVYAG